VGGGHTYKKKTDKLRMNSNSRGKREGEGDKVNLRRLLATKTIKEELGKRDHQTSRIERSLHPRGKRSLLSCGSPKQSTSSTEHLCGEMEVWGGPKKEIVRNKGPGETKKGIPIRLGSKEGKDQCNSEYILRGTHRNHLKKNEKEREKNFLLFLNRTNRKIYI